MDALRFRLIGGTSFSSKAIRWFTSGSFSHASFLLDDGRLLDSRDDILNGCPTGVHYRTVADEPAPIVLVLSLPCTTTQKRLALNFAIQQIGKPYDSIGIWGFAFGRNWREQDSWFCSELCAAALEQAGIFKPIYGASSHISPNTLADILTAMGASDVPPVEKAA